MPFLPDQETLPSASCQRPVGNCTRAHQVLGVTSGREKTGLGTLRAPDAFPAVSATRPVGPQRLHARARLVGSAACPVSTARDPASVPAGHLGDTAVPFPSSQNLIQHRVLSPPGSCVAHLCPRAWSHGTAHSCLDCFKSHAAGDPYVPPPTPSVSSLLQSESNQCL